MTRGDIDAYEAALRRLPEAHSLALRLKAAGVADEAVCGYLQIELLLAEAGGAWALSKTLTNISVLSLTGTARTRRRRC
jgi:hypothetical protein